MEWLRAHGESVKGLVLCALIIFGIKYGSKLAGAIRHGIKSRH